MDPAELTESVVRDLSRRRSRNDLILSVCQASGMDWVEAERFIRQVEANQGPMIARRQRPLLVSLALAGIVGGLIGSVGVVLATLDGWIILFLNLPVPYLGNVVLFGLGILVTAGGFAGLRSAMTRQAPL